MYNLIMGNKRIVFTMTMFSIFLAVVAGYLVYNKKSSLNDKVIRFHVLANSDSNLDQEVKIKVKDKVISYVEPLLHDSISLEESKSILIANEENIIRVANEVLEENGQTYTTSVEIGKFNFPVKSYGDIVFPSGEYDAFRIKLGKAEGKNWWCVMFPPLCFIDTKNAVSSKRMENELEKVLTNEEIENISQKDTKVSSNKMEKKKNEKNNKKSKNANKNNKKKVKKQSNKSEKNDIKQETKVENNESENIINNEIDINTDKDSPELKFKVVEIFERIFM